MKYVQPSGYWISEWNSNNLSATAEDQNITRSFTQLRSIAFKTACEKDETDIGSDEIHLQNLPCVAHDTLMKLALHVKYP